MKPSPIQNVFISAVTDEFEESRQDMRDGLIAIGLCPITQRELVQGEVTRNLLVEVDEKIRDSNLVVCLVGERLGWEPKLKNVPDYFFAGSYDAFKEGTGDPQPSATQWELLLALHYRKTILLCVTDPDNSSNPDDRYSLDLLPNAAAKDAKDKVRQHAYREWLDEHVLSQGGIPSVTITRRHPPFSRLMQYLLQRGVSKASRFAEPIVFYVPRHSVGGLFKGREEWFGKIHRSLRRQDRGEIVATVIHGLGGLGKSQLAVEYARHHAISYTAVLFVNAATDADMVGSLVRIHLLRRQRDPEVRPAQTFDELKYVTANWLAAEPAWLIVFDNVDTQSDRERLRQFLTERFSGLGHVLVTSQYGGWDPRQFDCLPLDKLPVEAGKAFLLESTEPCGEGQRGRRRMDTDDKDAAALAEKLDGLALALQQAAALILTNRGTSLGDYLERWEEALVLPPTERFRELSEENKTIGTTYRITMNHLPVESEALLRVFAFFAPDDIPVPYVEMLLRSKLWRRYAKRIESEFGVSDRPAPNGDTLEYLADYGLVTWDTEATMIRLHRVLQIAVRAMLTEAETRAVVDMGLAALSFRKRFIGPQGFLRSDLLHLAPFVAHAAHIAAFVRLRRFSLRKFTLIQYLVYYETAGQWFGLTDATIALQRKALEIATHHYGIASGQTAFRTTMLAKTLHNAGRRREAEDLYQGLLAAPETGAWRAHPLAISARARLANLLRMERRHEEAERLLHEALQLFRSRPRLSKLLLGEIHYFSACNFRDMNKAVEAEYEFRTALKILRRSWFSGLDTTLAIMRELALLLWHTNRYKEAENLLRDALKLRKASERSVAMTKYDLARLLLLAERLNEAEELLHEALQEFEKSGRDNEPWEGASRHYLAIIYRDTYRGTEAEKEFRKAFEILEAAYDSQNAWVARVEAEWSLLLSREGKTKDARERSERHLACIDRLRRDQYELRSLIVMSQAAAALSGGDTRDSKRLAYEALDSYIRGYAQTGYPSFRSFELFQLLRDIAVADGDESVVADDEIAQRYAAANLEVPKKPEFSDLKS